MMATCSRCASEKPLCDFPPSKVKNAGQWCRLCLRESKCGPPTLRDCDWCAETLTVTARRAAERRVYCSRSCKAEGRKEALRITNYISRPVRSCPHCGEGVPRGKRSDAAFCSPSCEQSAHNATRKASWKTGGEVTYVSRAQIIERDGGKCHLCGAFPTAAEIHLDHIIPLARGGTHEADNLAVACAACNLSKGARLMPEDTKEQREDYVRGLLEELRGATAREDEDRIKDVNAELARMGHKAAVPAKRAETREDKATAPAATAEKRS